nr:peptide-methionine (S)-S-oxide reductase MsrA [Oceanococcus sp. HetDA_MAG_MS8]
MDGLRWRLAPRRWATLGLTLCLAVLAWQPWNQAPAQSDKPALPAEQADGMLSAIFAGGCFWCMEADYEKLRGVLDVVSGYAGGPEKNPSYKEVSRGQTGHAEVVQVMYDPEQVSYTELLDHFWKNIDPTTPNRQFCDSGRQYRPALMPLGPEQEELARASLQEVIDSGRFDRVAVSIEAPGRFWIAEDYHQDYYKKNPIRYGFYRSRCGRDARLEELWG